MKIWLCLFLSSSCLVGCSSIKPYQKEYLLHPLMDDAGVAKLTPAAAKSFASRYEKLANGSATGSGGSSCPTCGG